MNNYVTGITIRQLREKKGITQKDLADILCVSDKTISKWETGRGLPDISLLEPLAASLGVSLTELLAGEHISNVNRSANILRSKLYICPVCGNIIWSAGECVVSCCRIRLIPETAEHQDDEHTITAEHIEDEFYVTLKHPMTKNHSIRFLAYITSDRSEIIRLYPEQEASGYFFIRGCGYIYAYCCKHGLFELKV